MSLVRHVIILFCLCLCLPAQVFSDQTKLRVEDIMKELGVPVERILNESAVSLEQVPIDDTELKVIEGEKVVQLFDKKEDQWLLYGSRILFIKRTPEQIAQGLNPLNRIESLPHPLIDLYDVSNFDGGAFYKFHSQIKKMGITVTMDCSGSSYEYKTDSFYIVQNTSDKCVDAKNAKKVLILKAVQSNKIYKVNESWSAVLVQNVSLIKRISVLFIKPSGEMLRDSAIESANETLNDLVRYLGLKSL